MEQRRLSGGRAAHREERILVATGGETPGGHAGGLLGRPYGQHSQTSPSLLRPGAAQVLHDVNGVGPVITVDRQEAVGDQGLEALAPGPVLIVPS